MSCPDWKPLLAHRFRLDGEPPEGWPEALAHLDGCPACRRRALALDPTLVFRHLDGEPAPEDVARLQQALRWLRRADRVGRQIGTGRRRQRAGWVAAAVLAAALVLLAGPAGQLGPGGAARRDASPDPPAFVTQELTPLPAAAQPLVEALDRPEARVYQFGQEDLSLVMIVDESLDV